MLIYEGLFYAVGSIIASLILSVVLSPMLGNMMSDMFWFVSYHFTIMPVILIIPVFLLLGWLIPAVLYRADKGAEHCWEFKRAVILHYKKMTIRYMFLSLMAKMAI